MDFLKNITPRDYQQKAFEKCIEKNCLVVLPTGLGKTLIALMIAVERMKKYPGEKVVFLAPTKPLVEQHLAFFKKHLPELFAEMILFTGRIKGPERKKLWQNSDIIFSTPQCIANDLKKNLYTLEGVCLLIEDEAHRCIKNYDYNYVAKAYQNQATNKRIVGLTASPGSDYSKIKEICRNLSIEELEIKTRDSEDVKEYLQELKFEKIMIDFPNDFKEMRDLLKKIFDQYITELRHRKVIFTNVPKTELILLQKRLMKSIASGKKDFNSLLSVGACSQAIRVQHAIELLETQTLSSFNEYIKELFKQASEKKSKGIVKLVSKPEFNQVYIKSNEMLAKRIEHPKIEELIKIIAKEMEDKKMKVIVFTQFRNTAAIIAKTLNQIQGINSKVFVGQSKKTGFGENTGLNQKEQKKIIQQFSSNEINVLCATSIGEEGLDIPEVNLVVFYEPVPSAIRKIQRSGRTARLSAGKLVILVTKDTRDETFYYVANAREKKMHKTMSQIKDEMNNKIKFEKQETL